MHLLKRCADPIKPENIEAFNLKIGNDRLNENILSLNEIIRYFGSDAAPGDYGTYGALVTAHSLNYILLTTAEAYYIANIKKRSGGKEILAAIDAGIRDVQAWPNKYFVERATHMTVEIEQKHSGGGGPLGRPGEKHNTGWYIVHDAANDPIVGTFEGQRFNHQWPNKVEMVTERYRPSEFATRFLPDILKEWGGLRAKILKDEPIELEPRNWWYRIFNSAPPYLSIDVINNPANIESDPQLHLVPAADVSGQLWQFRPSKLTPGSWNLCTLFLGQKMCLDVYGDDKKHPHLAPAGNYSGQQWQATSRGDGTWSLTNSYSGADLLLEGTSNNANGSGLLSLGEKKITSLTQKWVLVGVRGITEEGFLEH